MKRWISILVLTTLLFTACTPARQQKPAPMPQSSSIFQKSRVEQIRVIMEMASLRSGSSNQSPIIKELPKGNVYNVVGESNDWYVIETDDGNIGAVEPTQVQPHIKAPKVEPTQATTNAISPNEKEILRLLNAERSKNGLNPLKLDMEIAQVARLKSQDMIDNNYFSHNSPTYGSPFDMMKSYGIKYVYAGENLAGNPSIQNAHESLMNSQGHRENILNPNFTHIGIGVREGSRYGKMITQMFVGR